MHSDETRLHRDRPIDSEKSRLHSSRSHIELEADKFATLFLMPKNLVRERFFRNFLCNLFKINEETIYAIDPTGALNIRGLTKRELARLLADTTYFNGTNFCSLTEQFQVSIEAMAIRIEELDLIA